MKWVTATPISKPLRHSGAEVGRPVFARLSLPVNGLGGAAFEVGDDRVGQALPGQVQIGVGAELPLGGDAPHRTRNEAATSFTRSGSTSRSAKAC